MERIFEFVLHCARCDTEILLPTQTIECKFCIAAEQICVCAGCSKPSLTRMIRAREMIKKMIEKMIEKMIDMMIEMTDMMIEHSHA